MGGRFGTDQALNDAKLIHHVGHVGAGRLDIRTVMSRSTFVRSWTGHRTVSFGEILVDTPVTERERCIDHGRSFGRNAPY